LLLVAAIFKSYGGMSSGRSFSGGDRKLGLFLMICAHTTLLLGLVLWFFGMGLSFVRENGMGVVLKNAVMRYWVMEHFVGMLIAIVLITIGRGVAKKSIPDAAKFKRSFWLFLLALVIILVTIPWPFRAGVGRPWI
jgi:hypothetical protein